MHQNHSKSSFDKKPENTSNIYQNSPYICSAKKKNMKAIYLCSSPVRDDFIDETYCFYTLFLLTEESSFSCMLSKHISDWNNRKNWNSDYVIENYDLFVPPEKDSLSHKDLALLKKTVSKIKNLKHKDKETIQLLDRYRVLLSKSKEILIDDYKDVFEEANIFEWLDAFDAKTVKLLKFCPENEREKTASGYFSCLIKENILAGDALHCFNPAALDKNLIMFLGEVQDEPCNNEDNIYRFNFKTDENDDKDSDTGFKLNRGCFITILKIMGLILFIIPLLINKFLIPIKFKLWVIKLFSKTPKARQPDIYSIFLCRIPFGYNFSKEQMKNLRYSLQRKIKPLSDLLEQLKPEISQLNFDDSLKENIRLLSEKIIPCSENFQALVDDEIYFRGIINSSEVYSSLYLCAAVTSVKKITSFYEKNQTLLPFQADALRKELALHTDINKCRLFLYWRFKTISKD